MTLNALVPAEAFSQMGGKLEFGYTHADLQYDGAAACEMRVQQIIDMAEQWASQNDVLLLVTRLPSRNLAMRYCIERIEAHDSN